MISRSDAPFGEVCNQELPDQVLRTRESNSSKHVQRENQLQFFNEDHAESSQVSVCFRAVILLTQFLQQLHLN